MKQETNLNYLFIDQMPNFAHLITTKPQTKVEFLESIKNTYSLSNQKTNLFYLACEKSFFNTIKLNRTKDIILFNE